MRRPRDRNVTLEQCLDLDRWRTMGFETKAPAALEVSESSLGDFSKFSGRPRIIQSPQKRSVPQMTRGLYTKAMNSQRSLTSLDSSMAINAATKVSSSPKPKEPKPPPSPSRRQKKFPAKVMPAIRSDAHTFRDQIVDYLHKDDVHRTDAAILAAQSLMARCQFFSKYNDEQQKDLVKIAKYHALEHNQTLFKQDDHPDAVYLIISGTCAVYKSQGEMRKLLEHRSVKETVGGLYHLDERHRRAVTVEVSGTNLETDFAEFIMLQGEHLDVLTVAWKDRREYEKTCFLSLEIPVLNCVAPSVIANLSQYFENVEVPKDTVIYRQQDEALSVYFIQEGEVQIVRRFDLTQVRRSNYSMESASQGTGVMGGLKFGAKGDADPGSYERTGGALRKCSRSVQIAVLRKGEFFGEVEVFNDIPRTSAVIAMTPCTLLVLQKQTISGDSLPQNLLESLFRYASMRMQWRNSRIMLIFESLGVLGWQPERDIKLSLDPEIKPLARMRSSLLPMAGSNTSAWLGPHTVLSSDAREWGMFHYGEWARRSEKQNVKDSKEPDKQAASRMITADKALEVLMGTAHTDENVLKSPKSSMSPTKSTINPPHVFFSRSAGVPQIDKWE